MAEPCKTNAHIKTIPYFGRNGLYKMLRSLQNVEVVYGFVILIMCIGPIWPHYSNLKKYTRKYGVNI